MSFFQQPPNNDTSGGNAPTGGAIFGNQSGSGAPTNTNTGISANPNTSEGGFGGSKSAGGGLFGGNAGNQQGDGGFGGGNTTNTVSSGTGSGPFSGTGLLGGGNTAAPSNANPLLIGASTTNTLFGGSSSNTGGTTSAFGSGGGLFGASKSGDQGATSAPKPTMPNFFSNISSSSTASASGSTPALGGGIFTPKPADSTSTPSAGANPPAGSTLFGGGIFGKKPEDQATATPGASLAPKSLFNLGANDASKDSAPNASSGGFFNLGGASNSTKAPEPSSTSTAPTTFNLFGGTKDASTEKKDAPAAPSPFNLFGGTKDTSAEKKDVSAAPASLGLFGAPKDSSDKKDANNVLGLGQRSASKEGEKPKDTPASTLGTFSTTVAPAVNISVPPPSMLRGKTIEEIVNKWSADLETHVREFNKYAGEVAVWDRALIENGNNLAALYSHVLAAEREQNDIDQSLDHIEQQQKDLSATLDVYEKSTEEILGGQGGSLRALDTGPADNERDKNYMLATELHTHLDDLSGSLTQMIDSVNSLNPSSVDAKSQQSDDPMAQIAQILSSHLESLQWIDGAVREVEGKVTEVEKGVKVVGGTGMGGGSKSRGFGLSR